MPKKLLSRLLEYIILKTIVIIYLFYCGMFLWNFYLLCSVVLVDKQGGTNR